MIQLELFEPDLKEELYKLRSEFVNVQRALFARIGEMRKEHEFLYNQVEILVGVIEDRLPESEQTPGDIKNGL